MDELPPKPPKTPLGVRLRNNFLTGLIICAPIAITIWLTWTFIHWADSWVEQYPTLPIAWTVREFALVLSHVGQSRHEYLARWKLRDGTG